jgi:XRE family plasmid maintenance system antidote protein
VVKAVAELFPVGEFLVDELEARSWSQEEFARLMGRPVEFVAEIISGERKLTDQTAAEIGKALGTSAELWLNLQNDYLSWKRAQSKTA